MSCLEGSLGSWICELLKQLLAPHREGLRSNQSPHPWVAPALLAPYRVKEGVPIAVENCRPVSLYWPFFYSHFLKLC